MAADSIGIPPLHPETEPVNRLRPIRPKEWDERPDGNAEERPDRDRDGEKDMDDPGTTNTEAEKDERPPRGKRLDIVV